MRVPRMLVIFLLLALMSLVPPGAAAQDLPEEIPEDADVVELIRVIDGDTIEVQLENGDFEHVRLVGIDAPERGQHCFASEAHRELRRLMKPGRTLWLEQDVSERDRFGRLLAYVWLVRGTENPYAEFVNERLVREGFAVAAEYPPDTKHSQLLTEAMQDAQDDQAGFWSACGGDFRDVPAPVAEPTPAPAPTQAPPPPLITECGAFGSYEEAQAYYAANPSAQPYLDPNWDGRACEVWFGRDQSPPAPQPEPQPQPSGCDPSYPTVSTPSPPPDLDCGEIGARRFTVLPPDPHGFDGDGDGVGCESG